MHEYNVYVPTLESGRVLDAIGKERIAQDEEWGEQNHPDGTRPDPGGRRGHGLGGSDRQESYFGRGGMIEAVGFDLDSTIANTYHRQWMVEAILAGGEGAPTWDDYSMECANDTPIAGTVALMRMLSSAGHLVFIITCRSAGAEALTRHWLNRHHIPCDALVMRPAGDRTANGKFKVDQIRHCAEMGYRVVLFVEDWPQAAEYITEHTGIPCLLVNANYPADAPHQNENSRGV